MAKSFADEGAQLVLIDLHTGDLASDFSGRQRPLFVEANLLQADEVMTSS